MAFERVKMRTQDGLEYGPVSVDELTRWHNEGRVPGTAILIDCNNNEERPASTFFSHLPPPPPMKFSQSNAGIPSVGDHLIPVKNPKALIAYYSGVFGLIICPLGIVALITGIMGLNDSKSICVGKTHAIVGIVLGAIECLFMLLLSGGIIMSIIESTHR